MKLLQAITIFVLGSAVSASDLLSTYFASGFKEVTEDNLFKYDFAKTLFDSAISRCGADPGADAKKCKEVQTSWQEFKDGKLDADKLKSFMTVDATSLLQKGRQGRPNNTYRGGMEFHIKDNAHPDAKPEDVKKFNEHLLAPGDAMDALCDSPKEMGTKAKALFKDKNELVTCKSITRVVLAVHGYTIPGMSVWAIIGIVAGVVGALVIIGLLVYYFWWRPKKAAF